MSQPWRDKERLERLYLNQGLSMADVAEKLDCTASTINTWLEKFDIPKRTVAEGNAKGDVSRLHDESELRRMYVEQEMSFGEIAEEVGTSISTVGRWIKEHGIQTRQSNQDKTDADRELLKDAEYLEKRYYEDGLTLKELGDEIGCSDDNVKYWLEKHGLGTRSKSESFTDGNVSRLYNPEWLKKKYHKEEKSQFEIADELGVTQGAVYKAMLRYDIETRQVGSRYGEHNPQFDPTMPRDGQYYGPNWDCQRLKARIRDQARCQRCGKPESNQYREQNRVLHVHHIRNRRKFIDSNGHFDYKEANKIDNLISFCTSCHGKVESWGGMVDQR